MKHLFDRDGDTKYLEIVIDIFREVLKNGSHGKIPWVGYVAQNYVLPKFNTAQNKLVTILPGPSFELNILFFIFSWFNKSRASSLSWPVNQGEQKCCAAKKCCLRPCRQLRWASAEKLWIFLNSEFFCWKTLSFPFFPNHKCSLSTKKLSC